MDAKTFFPVNQFGTKVHFLSWFFVCCLTVLKTCTPLHIPFHSLDYV